MQYLDVFFVSLAPYLFKALGLTVGFFAIWALRHLATKFKIDASAAAERVVWNAAQNAVAYAEEWSLKLAKFDPAKLPSGAQKLQVALEFLRGQIAAQKLDTYGEDRLTQILEAALHVTRPDLTPPQTPAPSTPSTPPATPALQTAGG